MNVSKPAVFFYSSIPNALDSGSAQVRLLWNAIVRDEESGGLGMSSHLSLPVIERRRDTSSRFTVRATARRPERRPDDASEAYLYQYLDETGVCLSLAPNLAHLRWRELCQMVAPLETASNPAVASHQSLVLYGLYHGSQSVQHVARVAMDELAQDFPGAILNLTGPYVVNSAHYLWQWTEDHLPVESLRRSPHNFYGYCPM